MARSREHIYCCRFFKRITSGVEFKNISGKRCRVAGDVYYSFRSYFSNSINCLLVHAFSGRVYHNAVRPAERFSVYLSCLCGIAADKVNIFYAVSFGVLFCILYSFRNNLCCSNFGEFFRSSQRNSPRTAVKFKGRGRKPSGGIFHCYRI